MYKRQGVFCMMEFLATNFNLPTIIVGAIVFGGVGSVSYTHLDVYKRQQMLCIDEHSFACRVKCSASGLIIRGHIKG